MSTQKRFEIGVDYEGVSPRHLQVNEEVIFSNEEASRIFMPECGSFYVEHLIIKDNATGRELDLAIDYDVFILDSKATKESGKQVCGMIVVKNPTVSGVLLDYQFVGGVHSSGYYILEQLMKMYPNGTSAIISFDEVLNKPDMYDPAYHTQHVSELFKTNDLLVWLERLRQGIHNRQNKMLENMYNQATTSINALYTKLENTNNRLTKEIADILKAISIQSDEYILTDSAENPAVKRGYGNWVMITNTILRGGPAGSFLIGSGALLAMGSEQIIRNCYIWYNKQDSSVNDSKVVLSSDKDTISEGESITFTLTTTNIANATKLEWFLEGIDNTDILNNATGIGIATVNDGVATVTLTAAKDRKTEGNETFVFRLRDYPKVAKNFTVLDSSVDRRITAINFLDNSNQIIENVTEDAKFKLRIATTGLIGQNIYLKWSTDVVHLATQPPTIVNITANVVDIALETIGNLTPNITRILEVIALESADEAVDNTTPKTTVYILDTSQELQANVVFLNETDLTVTNIDEDSEFKIKIRTNGGVGQKLKVTYSSNRPLAEFSGLVNEVTIAADNTALITARNIANYETATETEFLEVNIASSLDNKQLASGTLLLNDTTKNPNFIVNASKVKTGVGSIESVNEGEDFYLVFKVPGWVSATTPPILDVVLNFAGAPSLAARLTTPERLTNIRFGGDNNLDRVEWLSGDTLAIKLSAIADKAIYGNAVVSVKWKMVTATTYIDGPSINIIDTSKPTLTASWSSSATELTPITTVNEMQTDGGDNVCFLWLDVDGDGSTFNNLKLAIAANSMVGSADLIQIYPRNLTIAKGVNRHIVRVDILADFLTEGNELLVLEVNATNSSTNPLVTAMLTITDNSVSIPITYSRPVSTIYSNGNYSEWENVAITINLQPLAFATTLILTATNNDKIDGLTTGSFVIPANQSSYTITIAAKKIRHQNGNYAVGLTAKRMFLTKTVSPETLLTTNFTNDRLFPSIQALEIYSNSEGTIPTASLEEGGSYWVKAVIDKPLNNMLVVVGNSVNRAADIGEKAGTSRFNFPDNRKVLLKATETRLSVTTGLISLVVPPNRADNPMGLLLELTAKLDWGAGNSSLTDGASYVESLAVNNAEQRNLVKSWDIVDLSKTLAVTGSTSTVFNGSSVTSFNEGDDIYFNFLLTNPTVGDVYELVLDVINNQIATNRYSYHEFASRDIVITSTNQTSIVFRATLLKNYMTDGDRIGAVFLRNKTVGLNVKPLSFNVLDTTKDIGISTRWLNATNTAISSINEGSSFKLEVTLTNLPNDFPIRLTKPTGRSLTDFTVAPINVNQVQIGNKVVFEFTLSENFKVDINNLFGCTVEVVGLSVAQVVPNLVINDTSKAPIYSVNWFQGNNNVTSVSEGSTATVGVITRGVALDTVVSVTLSGVGVTAEDVVGGQLTKTSTLQALGSTGNASVRIDWQFANDFLTEGDETITATVRIAGVVVGTANILVVDTSLTAVTYAVYNTSDAQGNNKVTTINEGDTFYVVFEVANLVAAKSTTWQQAGNLGFGQGADTKFYVEPRGGNITLNNGKNIVKLTAPSNYETTGPATVEFDLLIDGNWIYSPNLTILDTYQRPQFNIVWSSNVEGTAPITSAEVGVDFFLVVLTKNILPEQQFELSYPTLDGVKVSDFAYGPHVGTNLTSITQYDPVTKNGRLAITFKLK